MSSATEWHRAGIAVSGVTLVLAIAASIHFIAPARSTQTDASASTAVTTLPTVAAAAPTLVTPTLEEAATESLQPVSPLRSRVSSPRQVEQVHPGAAALHSFAPSGGADEPVLAVPLVASLGVPEDGLPLVEPMHMLVNAEFVEPALPTVARDSEPDSDAARVARQRDPVTAVFAMAGSAVAGSFRSAGRVLKRAF